MTSPVKCSNCGYDVEYGATECNKCGVKLSFVFTPGSGGALEPRQQAELATAVRDLVREVVELKNALPQQQPIHVIQNIIKGSFNDIGDKTYGERGAGVLKLPEIQAGTDRAWASKEAEKQSQGDALRAAHLGELYQQTDREWKEEVLRRLQSFGEQLVQRFDQASQLSQMVGQQLGAEHPSPEAAERERLAREAAERERAGREAAERERLAREMEQQQRAEERRQAEQAAARARQQEQERQRAAQVERQRAESERLAREAAARTLSESITLIGGVRVPDVIRPRRRPFPWTWVTAAVVFLAMAGGLIYGFGGFHGGGGEAPTVIPNGGPQRDTPLAAAAPVTTPTQVPAASVFVPTPTPTPVPVAVPIPPTPTPAPTATAAPTPTLRPGVVAATPTPRPAPTAIPAASVHPGKLTWMVAGWGNERFTQNFGVGGGNNYARILHGFLTATNDKTELLPGIASKWELSSEAKTWTFTILEGAKFHDGKALTAEDVWWTWMHYWGKDASGSAVERATQSSAQALARNVERIELTANNQVSFTRKSPDGGFPAAYVSEAGFNWYGVLPRRPKVHDSAQEAAYDKNPIGAGPGKLVRYVPAQLMAFERFDDYYYQPKNGLPEDRRLKFKSLDMLLVPEEATRVASIRVGAADIAPASLASQRLLEARGGGRLVFGQEGIYSRVMLLGCYKPQFPCRDQRVRLALDYAIDKTVIRDRLFGGPEVFQSKGWAFVTPSTIGYTPALDPRPFDPNKARQLLADAGYPGGKGFGKLVVNTWVSTAMPFLPESAQLGADFWKRELGLDVEVKVADEAALERAALTDAMHGQVLWREGAARLDNSSLYVSSYGTPGHGARLHESQELFDLVAKTRAVTDPVERVKAFNALNKRVREETYELGIGYVNIPWAVGPRVTAWQPWPLAFYPSNLHGIVVPSNFH